MCNGFSVLLADESGKKEFYINLIGSNVRIYRWAKTCYSFGWFED